MVEDALLVKLSANWVCFAYISDGNWIVQIDSFHKPVKVNTVSPENVPQLGPSSFNDHGHGRLVVFSNE